MKKYGRYIASYGCAFLISLLGVVLRTIAPSNKLIILLAVLSALPILLLAANVLISKQYFKKINNTKVADMQGYMLRHRTEAEKTSVSLLKKLQKIRHATTFYTVILWCLAACASVFGGMLYSIESSIVALVVVYAGTVFYAVYSRIRKKEHIVLNNDALVLQKSEYPRLYDTAYRAAHALDCNGEITILLSFDCNASIALDDNKYYLQLGAVYLNLLSEEELYCICLHEFSHYSAQNKPSDREMRYGMWISSDKGISRPLGFVNNLFVAFDVHYLFDHMTYQYATSVAKESAADRDMAKHGDPSAAASALLKLFYSDRFIWESGVLNEVPVYASEEPNPHYLRGRIEEFNKAIGERSEDWDKLVDLEILANNASHPTLKMRLETLGVKRAERIQDSSAPDYRSEIQAALDYADERLCKMQDSYEQSRKEFYLEPLSRISEWEENGKPISAETYADIISDLKQIGNHEEAEALCERAIRELDENSSQHAYFIKGCAMIYRYDEAGVDLVYHALENNHNYLEDGLNIIGEFFCITGREKELLEYRERARNFAQKDKDEYSETGFLSKKDNLSRDDMPREMLEEILSYIRSVDCDIIQNIYLVRKTVSDTFFTSAFVIHFYGGTDAQRNEIMHKIFRYLDTYPVEWQFSLFDYFDYPNIKFDSIEGSLVYSKSKNGGK